MITWGNSFELSGSAVLGRYGKYALSVLSRPTFGLQPVQKISSIVRVGQQDEYHPDQRVLTFNGGRLRPSSMARMATALPEKTAFEKGEPCMPS
jgi:hypothetical protein